MRKVLFAAACWAAVGLVSARASVTYQYVTDQSAYTGTVGSQVLIPVYLQETVTGTSKSIIFAEGGLFGAAVMMNSPGGVIYGSTDATTKLPVNDFKFNGNTLPAPAGFAFGTPPAPSQTSFSPTDKNKSGLVINGDIAPNSFNFPAGATGVTQKALIGSINVTVGATSQTLTITPYGGSGNTITQAGTDVDFGTQSATGLAYISTKDNPLGNFSFTVGQAIPEPGSMALCGLVACGMSYFGYRRRKTTEPAVVS